MRMLMGVQETATELVLICMICSLLESIARAAHAADPNTRHVAATLAVSCWLLPSPAIMMVVSGCELNYPLCLGTARLQLVWIINPCMWQNQSRRMYLTTQEQFQIPCGSRLLALGFSAVLSRLCGRRTSLWSSSRLRTQRTSQRSISWDRTCSSWLRKLCQLQPIGMACTQRQQQG